MKKKLLEAIAQRVLLGDGAMGTQLQYAGLEPGGCGEHWNVSHPERVIAIQKAYVDAGSDILLTNTFGGCRIMLVRHGLGDEVEAINRGGVDVARQAFGAKEGYVIGDIGPFGGLMEPYGEIEEAAVQEAFEEQAEALVRAGADAIIIETQTSLEELGLGIVAAKKAGAPCVIGSMAYDVTLDGSESRTMMGIDPEGAANFMVEAGADIVALNCGCNMDMDWAARTVARYRKVTDKPTMAQPNAGLPVVEKMKVIYKQIPEDMAAGVPALFHAGARIIGGCCGSGPEHIRLMRQALDKLQGG